MKLNGKRFPNNELEACKLECFLDALKFLKFGFNINIIHYWYCDYCLCTLKLSLYYYYYYYYLISPLLWIVTITCLRQTMFLGV